MRQPTATTLGSGTDAVELNVLDELRGRPAPPVKLSWLDREPALAELHGLDDPNTHLRSCQPDQRDEILASLIRLSQCGDSEAVDVILHLMMPVLLAHTSKLRSSTRTLMAANLSENTTAGFSQATTVAMCEAIADYPIGRRTSRVAANLEREAWRLLSQPRKVKAYVNPTPAFMCSTAESERIQEYWANQSVAARDSLIEGRDVSDTALHLVGESPGPDADLPEVLSWALSNDVITGEDERLLTLVYCRIARKGAVDDAAEQFGLSLPAVRQRCSRATKRIADAVHADVNDRPLPRLAKAS